MTSPAVLSGASGSCSAHRHIVRQIVQWNPILIAAHCRVGSCSIFTGLATEYPIFGSFAIFIFLQHIQFSGVGSLTLTGRAFPAFLHTDHFHWIGLGAQTACPKTFNLETLISDLVQAWHCDTNRGGLPWIYFHWPCWLCWQLWTTFLTLVQGVSHSFTTLFISGDRALTLTSQDTAGLPPVLISSLFSEYILRQWPFFYFLTVLLISWNFLGSLLLACSAFAEIAHSHWHKFESLLAGISHLSVDWTPSFGRSGPKSRRRVVRGCSIFWSLLLLYMMRPCKGEGYGPSMGAVAASSQFCFQTIDGAKLHGLQPTLSCGSPSGLETNRRTNKVVKRSLNRAYARALDQGFAWYRGHSYTAQELSSMGCTAPTERPEPLPSWQDLSMCNQHHSPKRRLVTWQWNCGGLTNDKLDELKAWFGANKVDIAVVLETRWRFDGEWSDPDWNLLHSGEGAHLGKGILTLISKRLCTSTNIKWQIHDSGRLVHVRLHTSTRPVDILACYQHTYQKNPKCMKARNTWWSLLDQVLHSLPHRNNLILLGDLNCNLAERTPSVGSSTFLWKGCHIRGTVHDDQSTLLHILRIHDLIALNASSSALGPTYVHYNQASRLDYICVRRMFADGEARRTVYLWQSPFIDQTNTGHAPILCTIAKHWIPPYAMSRFQKVTMQQRRNSRQAFLNQDATWRSFATETQAVLSNHLTRTDPANSIIEQMHQDVMRMFFTSFPAGNNVSSIQPWQTGLPIMLNKWEHRRRFLKAAVCTVQNIITTWHHVARFMHLKRQHRKMATEIRETHFQDVVSSAASAADCHDTHKLFHIINAHAPKSQKRQVQLRNTAGVLATPIECMSILNKFVHDTWNGPRRMRITFTQPPGVPFTVQQLVTALAAIPVTKAVAKPFAPGVVWKQQADHMGPLLHALLCQWWSTCPPIIPDAWRNGWLVLIPKPLKIPSCPQHLRPLALQEPVGKAVMGLLIRLALKQAMPCITPWPVWAYLEHRSTSDAIHRAALHCQSVRRLIGDQRSTPHQRARGITRFSVYGGLQVCIDLQRAFDCVNREKLFCKLHHLSIDANII